MPKVNYRKLYFEHYGIADPGPDFEIHHIDFNRANNNIDNLIMLPGVVHSKYHFCMNVLHSETDKTKITFDGLIDLHGKRYELAILRHFVDVMYEIEEWRLLKEQNDIALYMEGRNG